MKVFIPLILVLFSLPLFATAVSNSDEINIAAIFSQTGGAAAISNEHIVAVRFAVDEINRNGGVLGKKIKLIIFDNDSSALGSRQAAKAAVKAGVVAVLGGSWSSHALGMAPVLQKAGIPMLSPTATNPQVTAVGDYIFRVCFTDPFQSKIAAKFAYDDLKKKRAVVLTNIDQVFSIELSKQFKQSFQDLGGEIVASLDYVENIAGYGKLIEDLGRYNFDLIFLPGYTRDSAQIIKKAREIGIETTFLSGDGWSHLMYKYAPNSLDNSYYLSHWDRALTDQKSVDFTRKISSVVAENEVNGGTALAYDMVYLLVDAIRRAGTVDRKKIRDSLAATENFVGVAGSIKFDQQGDPIKPAVVLKFDHGGVSLVKQVFP